MFSNISGVWKARFIILLVAAHLGFSFLPSLTRLGVLFLFQVRNANNTA